MYHILKHLTLLLAAVWLRNHISPPVAFHCNAVLAGAPRYITDKLQHVLKAAARLVTGTRKFDRGLERLLHDDLHWLDVPERVQFKLGLTVRRCLRRRAPFCQSSSARGTASPSQHVWPSGLRSDWSDVLELTTEQCP